MKIIYKNLYSINKLLAIFIKYHKKNLISKTGFKLLEISIGIIAIDWLGLFVMSVFIERGMIKTETFTDLQLIFESKPFSYVIYTLMILSIFLIILGIRSKKIIIKDINVICHTSYKGIKLPELSNISFKKRWDIDLTDQITLNTEDIKLISVALKKQDALTDGIEDIKMSRGYIGIAQIPLVARAGFKIGDIGDFKQFENIRTNNIGVIELFKTGFYPPLKCVEIKNENSKELILSLSVSFLVKEDEIPYDCQRYNYCHLKSDILNYFDDATNTVLSTNQVNNYVSKVRNIITKYKNNSGVKIVHLFYAGPTTLIFEIGRRLSKTYDPRVLIYNYPSESGMKYPWYIDVMEDDYKKALKMTCLNG